VKAFFKEEFTRPGAQDLFLSGAGHCPDAAILNLAVIPFGSQLGRQPMVLAT